MSLPLLIRCAEDSAPPAALVLLLVLLTGCTSAPQTAQLHTLGDSPLASRALVERVPFYPQEEYQCGPAALAMGLGYSGLSVSPETLVPQVYLPARQGSLQAEMTATTRRHDRVPYRHPPQLHNLFSALEHNHPVIVLQNLGLESLPQWHYAVLIGYDLQKKTVSLHSGTHEHLVRPMALFEQSWRRADYWALSVLDPRTPPFGLDPRRYLQAVLDLQKTGRDQAAAEALQSAKRTWPDSPLPWILEGNQLYAEQEHAQAAAAFAQALERDALQSSTWNNLAYALGKQGCHNAAQVALSCALQLDPKSANLRHSQQELAQLGDTPDTERASCPPVSCPATTP